MRSAQICVICGKEGETKRLRDEETELIILSAYSKVTIMNNLEIDIRMVKVIRKALSILLIINAVSWFIGHFNSLTAFDIIYSVFMLVAGIVFYRGSQGLKIF